MPILIKRLKIYSGYIKLMLIVNFAGYLALLLSALSTTAFAATNLGTLSYWYSDSDTIGRWDESSVKVYKDK